MNLFAEAPTPPPIPARVPPPLHPYAEKYARKYEKKAAKWAEREQKRAEKYARKYGGAAPAPAQYAVGHYADGELASNPNRRTWGDHLHFWVRLAAVGIVLVAIFFPAMLRGIFPALMIAGGASVIILGVWKLFSLLSAPVPSPRAPYVGGPEIAAAPVFDSEQLVARPIAAPARPAAVVPVAVRPPAYSNDEYQGRQCDPSTRRVLSMRRRMTELSGSMTFAVLATAALTGVLATLTPLLPDAGLAASFATLVLLSAWTVMGATKILEGRGHDAVGRRILFAGLGLGLGALAFWLNGALLADLPNSNLVNPPLFTSVGQHALSNAASQPTLIGYLVFFGGLFATRRWWWHADSFRKRRFRVVSVLLTAGMAFLLSWVWQFPQVWGIAFATTVATVVHLSSVWTPPAERPKLVA